MSQSLALSVDFGQGYTDAWASVAQFVPKLVAFLVIMLIGWFVAKVVGRVADGVLRRLGFEKVAERGGVAAAVKGSGLDATGMIAKAVSYVVLLMVLQLGFGVFGPNPISDLLTGIIVWLPKAIVACVIVVVAMAVARAVRDIIGGALSAVSYGKTLATIAWVFIVTLGAFAALGHAGIATTVTGPLLVAVLATISGVVIVGVGGGLIKPMRSRWERWLDTAERETVHARASVDAYQRGRADALAATESERRDSYLV